MGHDLVVFSGSSNRGLAQKICQQMDTKLGDAIVDRFSDGETRIELNENIRGKDVFIIQSTCAPVNEHLMEALIMIDACRRASAKRITMVCPYFGYARQERKSAPRTPISAKLVCDLFTEAGIDRMLALELHASAIQGFFNIPVDHLFSKPIFGPHFQSQASDQFIVVSPDAGGTERARAIAKYYDCGLAIVDKRRDRPNESAVIHIIGDVAGKDCLIVDDICDTAGSLCKAAASLKQNGANSVSAAITHPVLSGPAISRIAESEIKELVVTDSIPLSEEAKKCDKITQLSVADLLSKAIGRIHTAGSISSLFV